MTDPTLDDHLDALGAGLAAAQAKRDRQRRRAGAGALLSLVAVAVGLGALVALPGGRQLDPVAEARAALEADGGLLHYVVRVVSLPPAGSKLPPPDPRQPGTEIWTATTGRDRYRVQSPADGRPTGCFVSVFMPKSRPNGSALPMLIAPTQTAVDGLVTSSYSPFSQAMVVTTRDGVVERPTPTGRLLPTPSLGASDPRDPEREIRHALQTGRLRDGGTVRDGERTLRKLVGALDVTNESPRPTQLTYLVDAETFAPVELRVRRWAVWSRAGGRRHWKSLTDITRFLSFERLPDTAVNRRLLEITPPQGTQIVRVDAEGTISPRDALAASQPGERPEPLGGAEARRRCEAAKRPR